MSLLKRLSCHLILTLSLWLEQKVVSKTRDIEAILLQHLRRVNCVIDGVSIVNITEVFLGGKNSVLKLADVSNLFSLFLFLFLHLSNCDCSASTSFQLINITQELRCIYSSSDLSDMVYIDNFYLNNFYSHSSTVLWGGLWDLVRMEWNLLRTGTIAPFC